jgi:hypothetical protein
MGNCENTCIDMEQKSHVERKREELAMKNNKNRLQNLIKEKSEILKDSTVNLSNIEQGSPQRDGIIFENGCAYEGDWDENLKRHGYGKYTWTNQVNYEGHWKNNMAHGFGKLICANGDAFEGNWENDKTNGYGEFSQGLKCTYKGPWKNDRQHGLGVEEWSDGSLYEGDFVDGKKHGFGRLVFDDGATFEVSL